MHFLETATQAVVTRRRFPRGAAAHLSALGVLRRASLVHCVFAEEVETLASTGACVVHCPAANLRLGSGVMPWGRFAGSGIRLALGTDGVLCNDSMSMLTVMKLAGLLHGREHGVGPQDLLRAATQGGAVACGLGEEIGRLEPGRRADLIVLTPAFSADACSQIVYAHEGLAVQAVTVDGRVVVRNGKVTTIDEAAALAEARERARDLLRRNAARYGFAREAAPYLDALAHRAREVHTRA
jgi:cytosine/adenosine deaminase-related metal-dependent hydrolase